jgi:tetratricopeptide (TPR) repeat protein
MMHKGRLSVYVILLAGFVLACSSPIEKKMTAIKTLEDSLFSDETKIIDRAKANELITLYIDFADNFKDDKRAAENLFKAGDMAMNLNMPHKAIQIFDRIMNDYADFKKSPQCLFLKGYIYENDLKDLANAKKFYEEFLLKYPNDEFADDAEISIQNLGKTPEELIREFEEKSKLQENI